MRAKKYLSFNEARNFVHKLKLKSTDEWFEYCKSGDKPDNIPTSAHNIYKHNGWLSFSDWVGTKPNYFGFLSLEELKIKIQPFNLKTQNDYKTWWAKHKEVNIPSKPDKTYENNGWVSWNAFFNITENERKQYVSKSKIDGRGYLNYDAAIKFVHKLNLKNQKEWQSYVKSGNKPKNIHSKPERFYKNTSEWKSWGEWLGTYKIYDGYLTYMNFEDAKRYVHSLKLKSYSKDWKKFCETNKPIDIPTTPDRVYKGKGWVSWGDFLGTGKVADQLKNFLPFEEAKEFIKKLGLKSQKEWQDYCKSGLKPNNIPSDPQKVYGKK